MSSQKYQRWQYHNILNTLKTRRVIILAGARQTGKTTLVKQLTEERCLGNKNLNKTASHDYCDQLKACGFIGSMSGQGNCYDNAVVESFFHSLKTERIHHRSYQTSKNARTDIFNYIEMFYNMKRLHFTLGYCSPVQFEQQYRTANVA